MGEIKPCPKCLSNDLIFTDRWIICENCGIQFEGSLNDWNARTLIKVILPEILPGYELVPDYMMGRNEIIEAIIQAGGEIE